MKNYVLKMIGFTSLCLISVNASAYGNPNKYDQMNCGPQYGVSCEQTRKQSNAYNERKAYQKRDKRYGETTTPNKARNSSSRGGAHKL